jgi:hypothetical protein
MRAIVVALTLFAIGSPARAETRDELQAKGEALGRDGKWGEAVQAFKAAEKLEHRAIHACLIALAYTRREAWPQAEVFLAACHEPGSTLPDWVAAADTQIAERLQNANLTEVSIEVRPAGTPATLTVSSFEPDEVFAPRRIHLPYGTHAIVGHAKGYPDQQQVVVIRDATPHHVVIDFLAKPQRPSVARPLLIAGAITLGASAASYALMSYEWNQLRTAPSGTSWDRHDGLYKTARVTTISFGAIGLGLVIAGVVLHRGDREVTVAPVDGGAIVGIGLQR